MGCSCTNQKKNVTSKILSTTSKLNFSDYLGSAYVRMSIGRNKYEVEPGLYKLGEPDNASEVFVSANYKLSFDVLRKNLSGMNAWILVLDTKGINVWCAAGKGTFGTEELIKKIEQTDLSNIVRHRRLIVPQLGAPGIAAHIIKESTGFKVKYGPIRAQDIIAYVSSRYKANESMRTVNFNFIDRLLLTPVEIANSLKYLFIVVLVFSIISSLSINGNSIAFSLENIILPIVVLIGAYLAGAFFTPILLPWLPSRYFAAKGMIMGFLMFFFLIASNFLSVHILSVIGWLFLSLAISSFLAMNFTGASTYTSLSGVKKEMKLFVPIQLSFSIFGFAFVILSKVISL